MTKKQGYSSIVCFITISVITIILLLNGIIIHAEGSTYWDAYGITDDNIYEFESQYLPGNTYKICMTLEQYRASSIYDSNVSSRMPSLYSINIIEGYLWNNQSTSSDYFIEPLLKSIPTDINPSEYPYFLITTESTTSTNMDSFNVYFFSENTNFISMGSYAFVTSYSEDLIKICKYNYYNGVYTNASGFNNPSEYNDLGLGSVFYLYYTNMPILCSDTYFSNYYDGRDYFYEHPENFVDQNYLLYDSQGSPNYNNPNLSGGSGSSETSENNMYLQFPKWYFYNIPKFTSLSSYYLHKNSLGSATFNCKLTDYQKEHLNEFSVKIDIQTYVDFDQEMNDGTVEHNKKLFDYPSQTISLSDFYSNSNNYNVLISDIFERSVSTDALNNSFYLGGWLESYDNIYQDTLNKLQGKFTATLISNNSNSSVSSGACTYTFDYMTGQSMMNDNTLGTNPNPDLDGDQSYNGFDDDNNQVISNGGNTLINNDNDTINFNGNGEVAERLVDELIPSSGDGGLTQELQDSFNTNGWLAVIKNTFSFIPESLFNTLEVYFVSILGILACAFVLRIILDLL